MCGTQLTTETQQEQVRQENTKTQSEQSSGITQETGGTSQDTIKESSDANGSDSTSKTNIEITDIIVGDVIDEHVELSDFIYTDPTYTCYPVMVISPDGTEIYNWVSENYERN